MANHPNDGIEENAQNNATLWKHRLYYANRVVHVLFAALPLVFFCSLLERFFRAVITGSGAPTLWWQSKGAQPQQTQVSCPPLPAGMASQDLWFTGLFLVCLTVLLVSSMVLMGRAVRRD